MGWKWETFATMTTREPEHSRVSQNALGRGDGWNTTRHTRDAEETEG